MGRVAYFGRMQRDLEPALIERVASARRSDRHRPLAVLVGSNHLASHLGRALARRLDGVFNVRFMTFVDAARSLADAAPGGARRLIPPLAGRVIVDELLAGPGVPAVFGEAAGMKGFGAALSATFADLSEGGCTAEIARGLLGGNGSNVRLGEKARATLELFARYRERVEGVGGDLHSVFRDALGGRVSESLGSTIYAYGFYDFNEMQRRLLDRIAERADIELFVPWREGEEAYRFAAPLHERLEASGFSLRDAGGADGTGPEIPPPLSLPDEEEEVREISRRILSLARDRGIPFCEMSVVLASPGGYADLVGEAFDEAGIPHSSGERSLLSASPAARAARSLLALVEQGLERRELVEFLVSAPLAATDAAESPVDHLALWVRHSAEAGVAGERGWIEESEALTARIAADVGRGRLPARSLEAARLAEPVLRRLAGARDSMRGISMWAGLSERFAALLRELLAPSDDAENVRRIIESLAGLDDLGCSSSPARFARIAGSALDDAGGARRSGGGVEVLSLREARGLSFRAAFLPGLVEGEFPGPARQDPLFSDADRAALAGASAGKVALPRRGERNAEEALLFALALESAGGECTLSYPRFRQGTGKERTPSFFLKYAGFDSAGGADSGARPIRLGRGRAQQRGLELLSVGEFDFESARGMLAGAGMPPGERFFRRGADLVRGRWGAPGFTAYDGVVSSERARAELGKTLEDGGYRFSPTALERWAACPFAYFLRDLLGIEAIEEPERIIATTPAQRGLLVHAILARLFGALHSAGLLPVKSAPQDRLFALADEVAAKLLDDFPAAEPVGLPVFWEMERRFVSESIRLFLEEERLDEDEFAPAEFEKQFGRGPDRAAVGHDRGDRFVFFHGRIDRIDVAPDGRFRVIDYKTGRLDGRDQDLGGGTKLQLPVYLLAAARLLGRRVEDGEALYRRVGAGGRRSVRFSGSRWSESSGELARIVETVTRGIEEGLFFASAGGRACGYCDFKIACPAGTDRLFERKARCDPRARGYLAMRGIGEEEEA